MFKHFISDFEECLSADFKWLHLVSQAVKAHFKICHVLDSVQYYKTFLTGEANHNTAALIFSGRIISTAT